RTEEHIHAELLTLRLVTADEWSNKKSGGKPGRRNPKNSELCMPGSTDYIWQIIGQRNSEEAAAFHAIMCSQHSHCNLQKKQQRDYEKVFNGRFLRGRNLGADQRIIIGHLVQNAFRFA